MYRVYIYLIGFRFLFVWGGGVWRRFWSLVGGGGVVWGYIFIVYVKYELVYCIVVRVNVYLDFVLDLDILYSLLVELSNL